MEQAAVGLFEISGFCVAVPELLYIRRVMLN
jgi:hypothetical protein